MTNSRKTEGAMDPTAQRILVHSHIATLEAEAAAERLARSARADDPRVSVRAALGRGLIAAGRTIAPPVEDPCPEVGAIRGA
jgi:hypothetical protein